MFAGFPGSVHDNRVLSCTNHKLLVINGERLNRATKNIQVVDIYEFIIGDAGYMASRNMFVLQSKQ